MSLLTVNQIVPLVAIIECPESETYFVRAEVQDKDKNVLASFALTDDGDGEFTNYSYLMPNLPLIKVFYQAFQDSNFQIPSDVCSDNETFSLLEIEKGQAVTTDSLVGMIRGTRLFGKINNEQKKLIGIIRRPELVGFIRSTPRLIGMVNNESLSGSLR